MRRLSTKITLSFSTLFRENTRDVATSSEDYADILKEMNEKIDQLCTAKKFDEALNVLSKFELDYPDRVKLYPFIKGGILEKQLKSTGEYDAIFGDPYKNLLGMPQRSR